MSKRLGLLIVMMLFVTMMTGCFGSDDSTTPTPATTSSVVITGTIPALSAPAGAPNKMVNYGTNYEMGVFNAATMTEITGSAVVINGTTYTATVPAGAANVTALIVIRHKTTGKVVYSAIAGNLPTTTQMSAASVSKVTVSGVNLNGESTALATIAKDKGVAAPSIPVSTSVTTMPATVKSTIDTAVGTATITAIRDAVEAVQTVLNASSVPETVKSSILSALDAALSNVLNAFVTAVKDASAVITSAGGATTVTVGGTTINSTTTPAQVTDAVNHVTVVTVTAVTNPSDIAVANGTAVSAIQFPTTVTVTLSNGQTATKNVVWSTTSTPAYNATVSGTYAFTGTVDGTTLKATVKVNVGIIQLKVATPTFTPAAGTFTAAQSVTIATTTEGATIYYTTDGTEPTTSSSVYASAINVAATTTIKAIATKTGMTTSDVASALYTINISLIPVISAERAVKQTNGDVVVTWTTNIVTPTAAKLIVSGDIPNPSYPSVLETVSTTTSHSVTIPAAKLAENSAYTKLVISYVIGEDGTTASIAKSAIIEAAQVVADPVFAPVAGTYTTAQSVTLTCATEGAEIYYTTDGSTPNSLSTKYTGAIALSTSATTNFKAIAVKTGMTDSNVVSATYVLNISTTKVLTGIALAKATDTVEAETAYTLPTAKASYDDNSVPADVTVSWVEVLAGGTSAVTLPVTKTTAGTYNFQASYTENGVTKTADFVLVVTEKVPVKTLDSITVVATPAAPTCLVGGTTSVALVVTAHYLTGTATSEAVVTTYTTGDNWANGIFTAKTTVAGTENIVVTYVEGGVTKTANVAVTVSVEAPKVTTVTVAAIALTENASKTAEVTVKDQFGATMTSGYTVAYTSMNTNVFTVSTTGIVTAAAYNSSATTGTLEVTVTPTTGTAVKGTAVVTVSADTTKPTLVSASAVNNKTILVTFSKAVKNATTGNGALNPSNYTLYNTATGSTAVLGTSVGASNNQIQATLIFSDTTQKVVKVTIIAVGTNVSGYPLNSMTDANYRLYVSTVDDTAATPNTIVAQSNVAFQGSNTPDSTAPGLTAATYNKGTGVLKLTFDKEVANSINSYTKFKFNGVVLTQNATVTNPRTASISVNQLELTLAAADKVAIAAYTTEISLTLLAGAVSDTLTPANTNLEATFNPTVTTPPALVSASLDETTNTLTLGFSAVINLSGSTFLNGTNFKLKSAEMGELALSSTDTLATTSNNSTVSIILSSAHATTFKNYTHTTPKVIVAASAVVDTNATANLQQDDTTGYPAVSLSVTKDTTKPVVQSITYNETTKKLVFTFNVNVSRTFTGTGVKLISSKDDNTVVDNLYSAADSAQLVADEAADAKTLTFDLTKTTLNAHYTTLATNLKAIQQGATATETPDSYISYFKIDANAFTKSGSTLKNDAVTTKDAATTVAYTDNVAPEVASNGVSATDANTVVLNYTEKVDTTSAQLVSNYGLWRIDPSTGSKLEAVTIYNATVTNVFGSDICNKRITLIVGSLQTGTGNYVIEVNNVKDLSNNVIASGVNKNSVVFNGVGTLPNAPKPVSAKIKDGGNGTLDTSDYIAVTFDRPVKLNSTTTGQVVGNKTGSNVNNFAFTAGATETPAFSADYAPANLVMSTDTADANKVVWIKLDSNLVTGTNKIVVGVTQIDFATGGTLVQDKYNSASAVANGTPVTIESPLGASKISSAVLTDVDNSGTANAGDKLVIVLSNPLKVTSGKTFGLSNVTLSAGSVGTANFGATMTTNISTTVSANTIEIVLGSDTTITPALVKAGINVDITATTLEDSWAIAYANGVAAKAMTTTTTTDAYITKVEWVDVDGDGAGSNNDFLYVTFNVPVYSTLDITEVDAWKVGVKNADNTYTYSNLAAALQSVTRVAANKFQLKLGNAAQPVVGRVFENNKANYAGGKVLTNFAGTAIVDAATPVSIEAQAGTDVPTISKVEFISESKMKVTFTNPVDISAADVNKFKVYTADNAAGILTNAKTYDPKDTTNKTVIFTLASNVSVTDQNTTITTVSQVDPKLGFEVMTANGLKNVARTTNLAIGFFPVSKDTTAPDVTITNGLAAQVAKAVFDNSNNKVKWLTGGGADLPLFDEMAQLEVITSATTPAADVTGASRSALAYALNAGNLGGAVDNVITGVPVATAGNGVYYRLVDRAGNKSAWVQSAANVLTVDVASLGLANRAADGGYVYNAGSAATAYADSSKLELYIHATTTPTGATSAAKTVTFAGGNGTVAALAKFPAGVQTVTTATAADKVWYRYTDAAGNVSAWVQDGTVPAAPAAGAAGVDDLRVQYNSGKYQLKNSDAAAISQLANDVRVYIGAANLVGRVAKANTGVAAGAFITAYVTAESQAANELKTVAAGGDLIYSFVDASTGNESVQFNSTSTVPVAPVTAAYTLTLGTNSAADQLTGSAATGLADAAYTFTVVSMNGTTGVMPTVTSQAITISSGDGSFGATQFGSSVLGVPGDATAAGTYISYRLNSVGNDAGKAVVNTLN